MDRVTRAGVILGHAFVPWATCGAIMMIGRQVASLEITLAVHAVAVPIAFGASAWHYTTRSRSTTPVVTAAIFLLFAVTLDATVIAPVFERSYAMFESVPGTWVPFALIFGSTYAVATYVRARRAIPSGQSLGYESRFATRQSDGSASR